MDLDNPVSPVSAEDKRDLLDDDGENRAVRAFLSAYQCGGEPSIQKMREHLKWHGFDKCWPEWVTDPKSEGHLTKGGAQSWLRYLFALEGAPAASGATPEGYVLVPIEPTYQMMDAPEVSVGGCYSCTPQKVGLGDCKDIYAAMIAAAPLPPDPNAGNGSANAITSDGMRLAQKHMPLKSETKKAKP